MYLKAITVENFKAVKSAEIPLIDGLTVLVGENSSGKSSILQAIHWACRCIVHPRVQRNQSRSIAANEFDYYPTEQVRKVGHNKELRQRRGDTKEINVVVTFYTKQGNDINESIIPISQGNNEVIKIDLTGQEFNNKLYELLADQDNPFSTYIPGLAGIPLSEEKRSRLPVLRQAASGDANTVLRNILLQIKESNDKDVSLAELARLCSQVLGDIDINVTFTDGRDFVIQSSIRTSDMDSNFYTPLEMAGTGVLQCIQIFSYILLYKPKLLLIDEPDAHLHPSRQERLVQVLSYVAKEYNISVIMTTHSPNVVRALPQNSKLIWMKSGEIHGHGDEVRQQMGWGVLDKSVILITEDQKPEELRTIIKQWPHIERNTVLWPMNGHRTLPSPEACESLLAMTGVKKIVLHRDGDFMTPAEKDRLTKKYKHPRISLWITDYSDIESYFLDPSRISRVSGLDIGTISRLYEEIEQENADEFENLFAAKRQEIAENKHLYAKRDDSPRIATARGQIDHGPNRFGIMHGKEFSKKLKLKLQENGGQARQVFSLAEEDREIATTLRLAIET